MTVITAPALASAHKAVADETPASSPLRSPPPRPDPHRVHRIRDDAEALQVARQLATEFAPDAAERDHERRLPWNELQRWSESGLERASDDPHLIAEVGRLQITLHAAHELLREAAGTLDELASSALDAQGRWTSLSAEASAHASVTVAQAKVMTTRAALAASEQLFELAGSSATRLSRHLDRHWRNARTHTLHDPVRWKYHAVGNYVLNDKLPPRHGAL